MSPRHAGLDGLLDDWRTWPVALSDRPRRIADVPGGRTNRSVRLEAPGLDHDLILRIHHPHSARLGIDRAREREIVEATAQAGIGRRYLHWDEWDRYAVFPWLEARTWTAGDLADPVQRARLRPLLDRLADLDLPQERRRYADYLGAYWRRLNASGRTDPDLADAWEAFEPRLHAFDAAPWPAGLVHHDLVPENILECDDRLVLIDWEYAAIGHPAIDRWSIDGDAVSDPFIGELMGWINRLWERLL